MMEVRRWGGERRRREEKIRKKGILYGKKVKSRKCAEGRVVLVLCGKCKGLKEERSTERRQGPE